MLVASVLLASLIGTTPPAPASATVDPSGSKIVGPQLALMIARLKVPSFSRQTKLACSACHNGFPQLTAFGRLFKLNGYTMTGLQPIVQQNDSASRPLLELSPIAPLSVMAITSATRIAKSIPDQQNLTVQFPQELSFFAAAAIADKLGIFSQFTYEDQGGTFSIDNVDLRFANHKNIGGKDLLYGVTLHNNPTVQDVWNSTPAWSYPFVSAAVAPTPGAATLIDGGLEQSVLGLGVYSLYNSLLYAEVTGYFSAPQGISLPQTDATAENTPKALSPYWRVGLQHQTSTSYMMLGTFGLSSRIYPTGIAGPTNRFTDVGVDAQYEQKVSKGTLIGRASYIHESQSWTASFQSNETQNATNTLSTYKVNLSYLPSLTHTFTVGYFGITGSHDDVLFAPGDVTGSATNSPQSSGATLEYALMPWLNVRLGAQYVLYQKFNGASKSYDVAGGRSAKDNNTLYFYLWLAY